MMSKKDTVTLPNGDARDVKWYQFRIPIGESDIRESIGGISDIRSIRFARLYVSDFTENTVLRFATLDLVRSDWRRYALDLDNDDTNNSVNPEFSVGVVSVQDNAGYLRPPGVEQEELNNNNSIIRQNEQSLVLQACDLEPTDSHGVYKNISIDMRQYKKLRMFIHAEAQEGALLEPGEMVGFIRMGNDFTQNYYQIEVPLLPSSDAEGSARERVWPEQNEIEIPLEFLQKIKALGISAGTLSNEDPTIYNVVDGVLDESALSSINVPYADIVGTQKQQRIAIKGNPNFGDIRVLMVGVKNSGSTGMSSCGEVWFNELRMSDMDNEGGWAAVLSMDTQIADFANISATGRRSTVGFGGVEQGPSERSLEDVKQYDVVTNIQLGQLLPKKWGVQVPFNYAQSEELITPKFDQYYNDLTLESRLDAATSEVKQIKLVSNLKIIPNDKVLILLE